LFVIDEVGVDFVMKIEPMRVHFFDQAKFPIAVPLLQQFFAPDGVFHGMKMGIPNERLDLVFARVPIISFVSVVADSRIKRRRHTDIELAAIAVGKDGNSWLLLWTVHGIRDSSMLP
jgi:hypothetical protein